MMIANIICFLILAPIIVGLWVFVCIGLLYLVYVIRDVWKEL